MNGKSFQEEAKMALQRTTNEEDRFGDPFLSRIAGANEENELEEPFTEPFTLRLDESDFSDADDETTKVQVEVKSKNEAKNSATAARSNAGGKVQSTTTGGSNVSDMNKGSGAGLMSIMQEPSSVAPPTHSLPMIATPTSTSGTSSLQDISHPRLPPWTRCFKCDAILLSSQVISHYMFFHTEPRSRTAVDPNLVQALPKRKQQTEVVDIRPSITITPISTPPAPEVGITPEAAHNDNIDSSAMAQNLRHGPEVSMTKSALKIEVEVSVNDNYVAQPESVVLSAKSMPNSSIQPKVNEIGIEQEAENLECVECDQKFLDAVSLDQHLLCTHFLDALEGPPKYHTCYFCRQSFPESRHLLTHFASYSSANTSSLLAKRTLESPQPSRAKRPHTNQQELPLVPVNAATEVIDESHNLAVQTE